MGIRTDVAAAELLNILPRPCGLSKEIGDAQNYRVQGCAHSRDL